MFRKILSGILFFLSFCLIIGGEVISSLLFVAAGFIVLLYKKSTKTDDETSHQVKTRDTMTNSFRNVNRSVVNAKSIENNSNIKISHDLVKTWSKEYQYIYENVELCTKDNDFLNFSVDVIEKNLNIVQEADNIYDNQAIRLDYLGKPLGYLYKGIFQDMVNRFFNSNIGVTACVNTYNTLEKKAWLTIKFAYKNPPQFKKVTLVKTSGTDVQDAIILSSEGEIVRFELENDSYQVLNSSYSVIGALPMSANKYIESETTGVIERIIENDNGKYIVEIIMQDK